MGRVALNLVSHTLNGYVTYSYVTYWISYVTYWAPGFACYLLVLYVTYCRLYVTY